MKQTLLFIFLSLSVGAFAQPSSDTFPDFTETDITGVEHNLNSYLEDGKTVVIDVFATWCPICVNSLPGLEMLEEEYGDQLVFLSFEKDASTSNEASWASNNGVTNPVFSNSIATMATWNTIAQPNFFVICPDGTFELKQGGIGSNPSILEGYIDVCLEGQVNGVEEASSLDFSIITNPVDAELKVQSSYTNASYEIYGITGELYLEGILENAQEFIVVSELSEGLYIMKVEANGYETVKKFIKN